MDNRAPANAEATFIPRNEAVIIQRILVEYEGISVPATAKKEFQKYALVLAVGPKVEDLEPGDRVIGIFSGAIWLDADRHILAMSEDVIIAKVEGGEHEVGRVATKSKLVVPR